LMEGKGRNAPFFAHCERRGKKEEKEKEKGEERSSDFLPKERRGKKRKEKSRGEGE